MTGINYGFASLAQRKPIPPLESVGKLPVLLYVRTRSMLVFAHEPPRQPDRWRLTFYRGSLY
jgi:hypothetical protein